MKHDSEKVINLELKREEKFLNFNDFQKQNLNFDIVKLQNAYKQIIKIKKFDTAGGISHFGAICLTRIPGDPESITNNTKYHNAFNGGEENRIHLVACVLDYKFN
jgi:hypothetical protein